jgi:hypothetical protein
VWEGRVSVPNRIVRDGFVDSDAIAELSDWSHRVYSNLIVKADDAGRADGRIAVLRSTLFPCGTPHTEDDVRDAVDELVKRGLVLRYAWQDKPFLQVTKWQKCGSAIQSRFPWSDGSHRIQYVERETRDGVKEFVSTSLAAAPVAKQPKQKKETPPSAPLATEGVTAKGVPFPPSLTNEPHFMKAWRSWELHLRQKRVRTTRIADEQQLNKCAEWGVAASVDAILNAIASNWQSLHIPRAGVVARFQQKLNKDKDMVKRVMEARDEENGNRQGADAPHGAVSGGAHANPNGAA